MIYIFNQSIPIQRTPPASWKKVKLRGSLAVCKRNVQTCTKMSLAELIQSKNLLHSLNGLNHIASLKSSSAWPADRKGVCDNRWAFYEPGTWLSLPGHNSAPEKSPRAHTWWLQSCLKATFACLLRGVAELSQTNNLSKWVNSAVHIDNWVCTIHSGNDVNCWFDQTCYVGNHHEQFKIQGSQL